MSGKLSRYFIEYQDPRKWTPELQESHIEDTLTDEDAPTLQQARTLARRRSRQHNTHVGIYERLDIQQIEPPYGPWVSSDYRYIEDGLAVPV